MEAENFKPAENVLPSEKVAGGVLERRFSKESAQELRDETAKKLRAARKLPESHEDLRKIKKGDGPGYEPSIQETAESVEKSLIGRIFKTYEFKQLSYKLDGMLQRARGSRIERVKYDYQTKLDKVLSESPLTEEEMKMYLSEEAVIAVSLEDYLTLLKRLSGNFVTHVTRQGIREQGSFHDAGKGDFFDSFTKILKGKELKSFLASFMTDPNSVPYIVSNIQKVKEQTGLTGDALVEKILNVVEKSHDQDMPADQGSVHMAVNTMASYYYGAEKGYDFYFYYPAEVVAYNYFHHHASGRQGIADQHDAGGSRDWTDNHNDLVVWNEGKGVPIDAGITCVPKDIQVDRETGSQYKIVDGKPIIKADGTGYELAEDTIKSQEFWENYFNTNPGMRPNKLIYGRFETVPKFEATKSYEPLFQRNVFKTDKDLPDYEKIDTETFAQYKIQLTEFIRRLEEEKII